MLVFLAFISQGLANDWNYNNLGKDWSGTWRSGDQQSPIDIDPDDSEEIDDREMYVYYYGYTKTRQLQNDGRNIWVDGGDFGYIRVNDDGTDRDFYAEKIVFKMPSEHMFEGERSEMEIQIFHNVFNSDGEPDFSRKAVVSIMIRPGDESYFMNSIGVENLPTGNTNVTLTNSNVNLMAIVDPNDYYFHYMGSISYPECEEDVLWYVFEKEQWVSMRQMDYFRSLLVDSETEDGNIRQVQDTNGRDIYYSFASIVTIMVLSIY